MSQGVLRLDLFLATALTHVHVGIGRSPGVVDLPVVRDSLGYPYLSGQSLKGALKTMVARVHRCIDGSGAVKCRDAGNSNCGLICCVFGGEPGDVDASGAVAVTDFYPLLVPVASLDMGVIYVTSPMLVARAQELVNAGKRDCWVDSFLNQLRSMARTATKTNKIVVVNARSSEVYIMSRRFPVEKVELDASKFEGGLSGLNQVYSVLRILDGRIAVVPEDMAREVVEKSLVRQTRIRLKRSTKTVEAGSLWTEEYVPHTTLFIGAVHNTGFRGKYCDKVDSALEKFRGLLGNASSFYLVVGGKETVGKGLLRFVRACESG